MAEEWQKVELGSGDDHARVLKAEMLIPRYEKARQGAGNPANAEVYASNVSGQDGGLPRTYYFEPGAIQFARGLLARYAAEPCPAPDIGKLRKL